VAIFAPGRQSDEELKLTFIARQNVFELLLEDIASTRANGIPQHHLIIGQRGMGKTTLLRRLDVALRESSLGKRFIPLSFPEEQWTVDRLSTVWLNCLDSFADTLERENADRAPVDWIDETVDRLRHDTAPEEIVAQEAGEALLQIAYRVGRLPVLFVDNLDLVFERLTRHELNCLRAFLTKGGAPILIGASIFPPVHTQDYRAPFYDHFKTHYLTKLSIHEMREVLVRLAERSGNRDIPARIDSERGRLRALHALTGGNPRTTVILFQIFARGFSQDAYHDLEALLDWMTPLYKARFEELADQAQVIVSALATIWEPATSARTCERTRLANNQVSSQLDRLRKAGIVEEVVVDPDDRSGPLPANRTPQDRTGFQLAERFFNIWFLMRQATRRDKRNLVFLTRFIECVHTPAERDAMARDLLRQRLLSREQRIYGLALEPAVHTIGLRYELHDHVEYEFINAQRRLKERIDEIIDPEEIPKHKWALAELRDRLVQAVSADAGVEPDVFADAIIGSPAMLERREAIAATQLDPQKIQELMKAAADEHDVLISKHAPDDIAWFQRLLRSGALADFSDTRQASEAFKRADSRGRAKLCEKFIADTTKSKLSPEAWQTVERLLAPQESSQISAEAWTDWGRSLMFSYGRYAEAEAALRCAIDVNPNHHRAWFNLGYVLQVYSGRPAEAEAAYRRAVELDPTHAASWNNLGNILRDQDRRPEAEVAYRRSVDNAPAEHLYWRNLARFLDKDGGRHSEAEAAYRKSIALKPDAPSVWYDLAGVLRIVRRFQDAEDALRKCIELDPTNGFHWTALARVLSYDLDRDTEAEAACRKAIEIDPTNSEGLIELGDLFHFRLRRFSEAEGAYRKGLAVEPTSGAWNSLGLLLADCLGRAREAADAFRQAIAMERYEPLAPSFNLVSVLRDQLCEHAEAEELAAKLPVPEEKTLRAGIALHPTAFAAYRDDWGLATQHLSEALDLIADRSAFPDDTFPIWMRTTAVLAHLGYGDKLLVFLRKRGDDQRLRPWYEAIRALLRGDRRYIRNIPAEMQEIAGKLYDEIALRLSHLPESTRRWPEATPKARRRRTSVARGRVRRTAARKSTLPRKANKTRR
jgi:tetratricopeptide (TPR) repeat protein